MNELITDRTQADVARLDELRRKALSGSGSTFADRLTEEERAEWFGNIARYMTLDGAYETTDGYYMVAGGGVVKGAYNVEDLNRVGLACNGLFEYLTDRGYDVPGYVLSKTDWNVEDVPDEESMTLYIENLFSLKSVFRAETDLPASMRNLNYVEANRIERLLLEVENLITLVEQSYVYSGEIQTGER